MVAMRTAMLMVVAAAYVAAASATCASDSDCNTGYICGQGTCYFECDGTTVDQCSTAGAMMNGKPANICWDAPDPYPFVCVECDADAQCTGGLVCNDHECKNPSWNPCDTDSDCFDGQTCKASSSGQGQCVDCQADSDCAADEVCHTYDNRCQIACTAANWTTECASGDANYCRGLSPHFCVRCTEDSHCNTGEMCSSWGECYKACTSDGECRTGDKKDMHCGVKGHCEYNHDGCSATNPCSHGVCVSGSWTDPADNTDYTWGQCYECTDSDLTDCPSGKSACLGGSCVECSQDSHCEGLLDSCDVATGFCVQCLADTDCPTGDACMAGVCKTPPNPACSIDAECMVTGRPVCDTAHSGGAACVQCLVDSDCPGADNLCWELDNMCYRNERYLASSNECTMDSECTQAGATWCLIHTNGGNECVECLGDGDCGPNRYCNDDNACQDLPECPSGNNLFIYDDGVNGAKVATDNCEDYKTTAECNDVSVTPVVEWGAGTSQHVKYWILGDGSSATLTACKPAPVVT